MMFLTSFDSRLVKKFHLTSVIARATARSNLLVEQGIASPFGLAMTGKNLKLFPISPV